MHLLRLAKILHVALKYGLDEFLLGHERFRWLRPTARALTFWRDLSTPRAERLRLALQDLGPIFVKFGQMLSTRRDLLPPTSPTSSPSCRIACRRFPATRYCATLQRAYGKPVDQVFKSFEREPIASASVAQVHLAELARRHARRGQGAATEHRRDHREGSRPDADRARCWWRSSGPTASGCVRATSSPNSTRPSTTSSTWRAKPPTARSCGATSCTRRCCWCRRSTGTGARAK